jgi:hypothetical protein
LGLLIELVSSHSHLYDVKNKNYKNNKMKDNTWEAIVLETTPDDCKRLWKNLRDRFTKEKRSRSGESAKESEWQYFKRMLFYDKHCTPRRTITATPCYSSGLHQTNEGGDNESSQSSSSYKSWTSTDGALSPEPGTTQENEDIQEFTTQENEDSQQFSGSQPLHSSAMSPSVQVVSGERAKRLRPAVQTALLTTPGKKRQKVENKEIGGMVQIAKQISDQLSAPTNVNEAFGKYVASRLNEMSAEEAKSMRKTINNIIDSLKYFSTFCFFFTLIKHLINSPPHYSFFLPWNLTNW